VDLSLAAVAILLGLVMPNMPRGPGMAAVLWALAQTTASLQGLLGSEPIEPLRSQWTVRMQVSFTVLLTDV
jgi:hypothetical protein